MSSPGSLRVGCSSVRRAGPLQSSFQSARVLLGQRQRSSPTASRSFKSLYPSVFVSVLSIGTFPVSVVSVSGGSVFISVQLLILAYVAVIFMVCAAAIIPVICWRCSAAVAASFRGLAPLMPFCSRASGPRLFGALLQASGAQGVEEEALVGAA